jgi:hypothetical protein
VLLITTVASSVAYRVFETHDRHGITLRNNRKTIDIYNSTVLKAAAICIVWPMEVHWPRWSFDSDSLWIVARVGAFFVPSNALETNSHRYYKTLGIHWRVIWSVKMRTTPVKHLICWICGQKMFYSGITLQVRNAGHFFPYVFFLSRR